MHSKLKLLGSFQEAAPGSAGETWQVLLGNPQAGSP
jgi:hypothetical protein